MNRREADVQKNFIGLLPFFHYFFLISIYKKDITNLFQQNLFYILNINLYRIEGEFNGKKKKW